MGPDTDWELGYRKKKDFSNDPIKKISKELKKEDIKRINTKIHKKILAAFNFAEKDKFPIKKDLMSHNYEK